ncbi:MAG: hypothetical protein KAR23_01130, partial [Candidatus Aenigmarchaeota archaeon]|nr:hypothetical protein [Candidatus Aenigmarchaeota archaeon]
RPGETAGFIIVVLDGEGYPVCSTDIGLSVIDPVGENTDYSTVDGTITTGSECGLYNAYYQTSSEGNHTIDITAQFSGIDVNFSTYFLVQQNYAFDIIRTAQSKIDPTIQNWFDVIIDIESFVEGDVLTVKEFVPIEFDVATDAGIEIAGDAKVLIWDIALIDNKTSVSYSYSVPHVWPYLYTLGSLEIVYDLGIFTEARLWYVAVDPAVEQLENPSFTDNADDWTLDIYQYDGATYQDSAGSIYSPGGDGTTANATQDDYDTYLSDDNVNFSCYYKTDFDDTGSGTTIGSLYAEIENESDPGTWIVIYTFFENDQIDRPSFVSTGELDVSSYFDSANYRLRFRSYTEESTSGYYHIWIDNCTLSLDSPPTITIVSPENTTYPASVWFNVTLDEAGSWCGYSLDNVVNVTMDGSGTEWYKENATMSEGSHHVTFSCNDTAGNMNSSAVTVYFTVDTTYPQYSLNQT